MQQAILVSAMALLNPGQSAWIEDPGYHLARRALALVGAKIVPKRLDSEGLVVEQSPKEPLPRIIYVTPSHQYPLGITMSFERRTALLNFAREAEPFSFEH